MAKIIGICGLIGSGKGTVADILEESHGFVKISFADSLKDAVAAVFGWQRSLLEGDTDESRAWREEVDVWWAKRLGNPHLTPRWVLQYWGTEVCREGFHTDIWISSVERKIADLSRDVVIPDTRFLNEVDMIQRLDGRVWWVRRGRDPDWFSDYRQQGIEPNSIHASEWAWARSEFDAMIQNDGTLEDLRTKSRMLVDNYAQNCS
jgi:hypothetical protein